MGCYRKALSSKGRYVRPRDYYGIVSHFYQVVTNKASFGILADSSSEGTGSSGGSGVDHKSFVSRGGPRGHLGINPQKCTLKIVRMYYGTL